MKISNIKIAKLIYQSKHRGCKENDILLSLFANKIQDLSIEEINLYEAFLSEDDTLIYQWMCNIYLCPEKYKDLLIKIVNSR